MIVDNEVAGAQEPTTTGRYVVTFARRVDDEGQVAALDANGLPSVASSRDFAARAVDVEESASADAVVFAGLGVAVVTADEEQARALAARDEVLAVEPELVFHVLRDTLTGPRPGPAAAAAMFADTASATWGLQATEVVTASRSGRGVRVAVLDTGFDMAHPDFTGRPVVAQSFVTGTTAQDGHGHGTHCVGTSCGPQAPNGSRRYGVAYEAEIFVGKVLSDAGSGTDTAILAGIEWAINQGCKIVSMSLGADVRTVSQRYEHVGRRALDAGTLIVAAAGNNAHRAQGDRGFVGIPANSPSIMAVGALDAGFDMGWFSARSNSVGGGQVDIAAPGVAVYSSWPMPARYNSISGTSMATPHVSGIAALWCEKTGATDRALWSILTQEAHRLPLSSLDVGAGLVIAPQ